MPKQITPNQLLGELGEVAVRQRFLSIGFQFDARSRLEAGIDGIAEVMKDGKPLAKMIAVQVKSTESRSYASEDNLGFTYRLKKDDLEYWRGSNLPVIIVLYRKSDETLYWKEVPRDLTDDSCRLQFDKQRDVLDLASVDRLAAITVPKTGFGYYVPPLGGGEEALVNILPVVLPREMFVCSTPHSGKRAAAILLESEEPARFDWIINGSSFWSFHDPRTSACREIIDIDQVDAIDTNYLAYHEDIDEQNNFAFLLKQTLRHQVRDSLRWEKERKLLYFMALQKNTQRKFHYEASRKKTHAEVVNVVTNKKETGRVDFVRHHAFVPRFELLGDQWFLVITPTYYFTIDGFTPHSYPQALLAGKKRMDNSASLRGQVIMWHRFLTQNDRAANDLFGPDDGFETYLRFDPPPQIALETKVPEDVWGTPKKVVEESSDQKRLAV